MVAVAEYFIYSISLERHYLIGMLFMVISAVTLSLNSLLYNKKSHDTNKIKIYEKSAPISSYIPVTFAIVSCIFFTCRIILMRKMTAKKFGICFDTTTLSMMVFFIDNTIFLVAAIFYWNYVVQIDWYVLLLATIGIIIDSAALTIAYLALERGPGGPITGFFCCSSIGITIIESIRYLKLPTTLEFVGGIIGLIGAFEFVIPDKIERILMFWKWCQCSNNNE